MNRIEPRTEMPTLQPAAQPGISPGLKGAGPPVAPSLSRAELRAAQDQATYRQRREVLERRSVLRGLILLAVLIVLFAVMHGGAGRAFPSGWWRQW